MPKISSRAAVILVHLHDGRTRPPPIREIGPCWTVVAVPLEVAVRSGWGRSRHCLIDVDVTNIDKALALRSLLASRENGGCRIFACPRGRHHAVTQAQALGATRILGWPLADQDLYASLADIEIEDHRPVSESLGAVALDLAFNSLLDGRELPTAHIEAVTTHIASDIEDLGINEWLGSIRQHHAGTYQHCLIVTGLATAFGQAIGLSKSDLQKVTVAALLHDIGKARIDAAILDKVGPLTLAERSVIEMHPAWGAKHLEQCGGISPDIIDCVRGHHEFLDGSGYPEGLAGGQIGDLTRILTIVDIFGALVERRSYKEPMPGARAFSVLCEMARDGKLELALVEAFKPVADQLPASTARLQDAA